MKKILYLIMAMVIISCNDKDDVNEGIELPQEPAYTSLSKSEIAAHVEKTYNNTSKQVGDFYKIKDDLEESVSAALYHYRTLSVTSPTRTSNEEISSIKGVKMTWNPETVKFDMTLDATGLLEYVMPLSIEDDSQNNLRIVMLTYHDMPEPTYISPLAPNVIVWIDNKLVAKRVMTDESALHPNMHMEESIGDFEKQVTMATSDNYNHNHSDKLSYNGNLVYANSLKLENDNIELITEIGNICFRYSLPNGSAFFKLIGEVNNDHEGSSTAVALLNEILNTNIRNTSLLFTDTNEKLGDIKKVMVLAQSATITLTLKNGEEMEIVLPNSFLNIGYN
ncbi:MAG: hypothetical protein ACRDDZ_04525 [Marinifilaceae bacterium]